MTASTYKSLDEKINSVATKVIHLGDQLESVNTPRSRDVEALKLMRHFEEFLGGETSLSSVFNDKSRLYEAADIIRNLQLIAQELPSSTDTSMNIDMKSSREGSRIKVYALIRLWYSNAKYAFLYDPDNDIIAVLNLLDG